MRATPVYVVFCVFRMVIVDLRMPALTIPLVSHTDILMPTLTIVFHTDDPVC